jgi:O-antigen ligase
MEMALPVTIGLAAMIWGRQRSGRPASGRLVDQAGRGFAGFTILAFVIVIGLTAFVVAKSRGGFLAFSAAVGVCLLVMWSARRLSLRIVAAAVIVLLATAALAAWIDFPELVDRYGTLGDVGSDPSFLARIDFSRHTLRMAADFPAFGTGLGTFAEAYDLYTPGTSHVALRRAHNDYAQVFAECGFGGLIAALWAVVTLMVRGLGAGLVRRGSPFRWTVTGAAVGVLALLLHSAVDFNLQIYSNSVLFVILCAFLMRDRLGGKGRRMPESA